MRQLRPTGRRRRAARGQGGLLRETLIDVATDLLIEQGCAEAVSIRSVAQGAGVTTPSVYLHFADKGALLDAACAPYFQGLDEQLESAARACASPADALPALAVAYVRFATKSPELYRIATMVTARSASDVDAVLADSAFVHLRAAVQRLIDDGSYPMRDADAAALELWTVAHGVAALVTAKPYWPVGDPDQLTDRLIRAVCYGHIALSDARACSAELVKGSATT